MTSDNTHQPPGSDPAPGNIPGSPYTPEPSLAPDLRQPEVHQALMQYWQTNIRIMAVLLLLWAAVSLGCGVLLAGWLNQFKLGGVPLGFWFAQQGSIITFVLLILVYAVLLNRLDLRHHRQIQLLRQQGKA